MLRAILHRVQSAVHHGLKTVGHTLARWTTPIAQSPVLGTVTDLARSKPELIAENLLLRQQLIVLKRSVKRPHVTRGDRAVFVLLASKVRSWKEALLIVKPETVLRWHRQGFQLFWKRKSRAISRDPKIPLETSSLIKEMAINNRLWGAERKRQGMRPSMVQERSTRCSGRACNTLPAAPADRRPRDHVGVTRAGNQAGYVSGQGPRARCRGARRRSCRPDAGGNRGQSA